MVLPWKGGVEAATKLGHKYGSLFYLAMLQGLRGAPLSIDTNAEITLTCTRTQMSVTYTLDSNKYSQQT